MSAVLPKATAWSRPWEWPADVLEAARAAGVEAYLGPLLEATRRVCPTAVRFAVIIDDTFKEDWPLHQIFFEVTVPRDDHPDYVRARHAWTHELFRLVPSPKAVVFGLGLEWEEP